MQKCLLKNGADVNAQNHGGSTPLHWGTRHNSTIAMKALLNHGADPSILNNDGRTPFDYAREMENEQAIRLLEQY